MVADLGIGPDEIAETALRFVLSSTAVSTVIPGMRSVCHVERNTALSDGRPLTAEQLAVLARHRWQRHFYPDLRRSPPVAVRARSYRGLPRCARPPLMVHVLLHVLLLAVLYCMAPVVGAAVVGAAVVGAAVVGAAVVGAAVVGAAVVAAVVAPPTVRPPIVAPTVTPPTVGLPASVPPPWVV